MTTELPDKKMPNPHQPLGSGCVVGVDSLERPLRLLHDWREGLYGVEELVPLVPILDVAGVDVEALHFTRDVLRHYLEAVKASRLGNLDMYNVTMILGFNLSSILFIFDFKQKCETAYPASLMKIKIVLKVFFLVAQYFSGNLIWNGKRAFTHKELSLTSWAHWKYRYLRKEGSSRISINPKYFVLSTLNA